MIVCQKRLAPGPISALLAVGLVLAGGPRGFSEERAAYSARPPAARPAAANRDEPGMSPQEVTRWIQELGDAHFAVREKATKALEEAGGVAVPGLTEAAKSTDPEVRRRAQSLLERIEVQEAIAPTRVSLHLHDVPLPEAVEKLAQQGKIKLLLVPRQGPARAWLEERRIRLDLTRVPYWEALERLCETGSLTYSPHSTDALQLQSPEGYVPPRVPTAVGGVLRFRVTGMNYSRNLSFVAGAGGQVMFPQRAIPFGGAPPVMAGNFSGRQENLTVTFDVLAEPRLRILSLGNLRLTAAEDETGQSLLMDGPLPLSHFPSSYYGSPGLLQPFTAQSPLRPPTKPAARLKMLAGTLELQVMARRQPLVQVDNFLDPRERVFKAGNATLVILHSQNHGQGGSVRFALVGLDRESWAGEAQPVEVGYTDLSQLRAQLEVTDAAGRPINANLNLSPTHEPGQKEVLEGNIYYHLGPDTGPPSRLTLYPSKRIRATVPFEFKDVPMP